MGSISSPIYPKQPGFLIIAHLVTPPHPPQKKMTPTARKMDPMQKRVTPPKRMDFSSQQKGPFSQMMIQNSPW